MASLKTPLTKNGESKEAETPESQSNNVPVATPLPKSGKSKEADTPESHASDKTGSTATNTGSSTMPVESTTLLLDQEGFPDSIKNKVYCSESDLVDDLEEAGLIDDYKYIALTAGGRPYRTERPGICHESMVDFLATSVKKHCGGELLCKTNYEMNFHDSTSKFPDLAIFGEARHESIARNEVVRDMPKTVYNEQFKRSLQLNPDLIIEFSFTHQLQVEIPKFEKQMNDHMPELEAIKVGYLIKAIPAGGKQAYPSKKNPDNALCGFNLYELRGNGNQIVESEPTAQYRVGGDEQAYFTITDEDLGRPDSSGVYRIPLSELRDTLEQDPQCNVKFEQKRGE